MMEDVEFMKHVKSPGVRKRSSQSGPDLYGCQLS